MKERVPYEGRTGRSDRAGKTRTALQEMRTALLETPSVKSMRVNDKTILLLPNFVPSILSHEIEHSESEFYYQGELFHAELLQSPTHSESKERNLSLLANDEAHNFLGSQQANSRSKKQLFRINCPIINLWNKQTVLRRNFFPWRASKNSSWVKARKPMKKTKYDKDMEAIVFIIHQIFFATRAVLKFGNI